MRIAKTILTILLTLQMVTAAGCAATPYSDTSDEVLVTKADDDTPVDATASIVSIPMPDGMTPEQAIAAYYGNTVDTSPTLSDFIDGVARGGIVEGGGDVAGNQQALAAAIAYPFAIGLRHLLILLGVSAVSAGTWIAIQNGRETVAVRIPDMGGTAGLFMSVNSDSAAVLAHLQESDAQGADQSGAAAGSQTDTGGALECGACGVASDRWYKVGRAAGAPCCRSWSAACAMQTCEAGDECTSGPFDYGPWTVVYCDVPVP